LRSCIHCRQAAIANLEGVFLTLTAHESMSREACADASP
jgi:hypothetical protein